MKSIVSKEKEVQEQGFPKLMSHKDGTVVLFYAEGEGMCVASTCELNYIGQMSTSWNIGAFMDFNGTVTLSNK